MDFGQLDCIIKIGGAAITLKETESCLNPDTITKTIQIITKLKKDGLRFILVHGAGSFGHIHASRCDIKQGGIGASLVRERVTLLNHILVEKLVNEGIEAVTVSPFLTWETSTKDGKLTVVSHNAIQLKKLVDQGFLPILHGDVVTDQVCNFTILSGDVIAQVLAETLRPKYVTFLSNIEGIFTKPPEQPGAKIIPEIRVDHNGKFQMPETDVSDSDVTGGIDTKLSEAGKIAQSGIVVYFALAGTDDSLLACQGNKPSRGTVMFGENP